MGEREITRRQVLAGVAGVGGVGSVLGTGTAAFVTDEEIFENSRFGSGTLDLVVEARKDGDEYNGEGEITVPVDLEKKLRKWWEDDDDSWDVDVADSTAKNGSTYGTEQPQTGDATPQAESTPTPEPSPTPTPESTTTPDSMSTPESTPTPEPTPTPQPTSTPETEDDGGNSGPSGPGVRASGGPGIAGGGIHPGGKPHGGNVHGGGYDHDWWKSLFVWTDSFEVTVTLPDLDGENNAAFAWVGSQCPEDDLAEELEVTIRYANEPSDGVVYAGSLGGLAGGLPLDPDRNASLESGDQRCFEPGEEVDLEVVVEHDYLEKSRNTSFTLEFVATQCRNNEQPNPFPDVVDCGSTPSDPEHGISFVAFCSSVDGSADGSIDPRVTAIVEENDEGEPLAVDWETDVAVDFVVLKASTLFTVYDYRGLDATSGTTTPSDSDAEIATIVPHQSWASDPCGLAADVFGEHPAVGRSSAKLDADEGDLEVDGR